MYFTEKHEPEARAALAIAVTNSVWTFDAEGSFHRIKEIYEAGGLSELDAAIFSRQYNRSADIFFAPVVRANVHEALWKKIDLTIEEDDHAEFSTLIKLVSDLRKANCSDHSEHARNVFRNSGVGFEEANDMARKTGRTAVLITKDTPDEQRLLLYKEIFERSYAARYVDPRVLGGFIAQGEEYETEARLRSEIRGDEVYAVIDNLRLCLACRGFGDHQSGGNYFSDCF